MQVNSLTLAQIGEDTGTNTPPEAATTTDTPPSALSEFFDTGAMGLLVEGGPFMWPILEHFCHPRLYFLSDFPYSFS